MLRKLLEVTEVVFCTLGAIGLAVMAVALGGGIVGRYFFNQPIPGVYDIITLLMVWVVFLSLAYTQRHERHIKIEILTTRFSARAQEYLNAGSCFIAFVFCAVMSWQAGLAALHSVKTMAYWPGLLRTPIYPSKLALFAGVVVLSLRYLVDAVDGFRQRGSGRLNQK